MPLKAVNSLVLCLGHTTDRPFTLPGALQADYCKLLHIDALELMPAKPLITVGAFRSSCPDTLMWLHLEYGVCAVGRAAVLCKCHG